MRVATSIVRLSICLLLGSSLLACMSVPTKKPGWQRPVFYPHGQTLSVLWHTPLFDRGPMDYEPIEDGGVGVDLGEKLAYVGGRSKILHKLDLLTGKVLKKRRFESEIFSKPVVHQNMLLLGSSDGSFYALNKYNLEDIWSYRGKSEYVAEPVIAERYLYIVSQGDVLTALDVESGKFVWEANEVYTGTLAIRRHASPVVAGGVVYQGFSNGNLVAYNRFSGEVLWKQMLGRGSRFDDANGTPVVKDGVVYVTSFDNGVYALDAQSGTNLWYTPLRSASAPMLWEGLVLVTASESGFYALEKTAGKIEWYFDLTKVYRKKGEGVFSRPLPFGFNQALFTTSNGGLYVLDLRNRQLVERLAPGIGISAEPTVAGNLVLFLSNGGAVNAAALAKRGQTHSSAPKPISAPYYP